MRKYSDCEFEFFESTQINEELLNLLHNYIVKDKSNFLDVKNINTGRKNHRVFLFRHKEKNYFAKEFFLNNSIGIGRRLELSFKEILKPAAQRSYEGSVALYKNEIPTPKPVAYFASKKMPWNSRSIVVLETIEDAKELFILYREKSGAFEKLFKIAASYVKLLHDSGYRHTDIVLHNFLVQSSDNNRNEKLFVIDTDKVHKTLFSAPIKTLKTFFDLRCIRRLEVRDDELELFLKNYFGSSYSHIWKKVLYFWRGGGFNPMLWYKSRVKKKY